jgi:hypothetical protein
MSLLFSKYLRALYYSYSRSKFLLCVCVFLVCDGGAISSALC